MPKVSQDHIDERRDSILEAAARCFAHEGFHATSVADVILESGLSAGSVYRYFKNKDDLITAIIDRYLETVIGEFFEVNKYVTDPAEAVISVIKLISKHFQSDPPTPFAYLMPQIWSEAMRNQAILERGQIAYRALLGSFEDTVRRAQADGRLRVDLQPKATSHLMLSLVQGYILQVMLFADALNMAQYVKTVRQILSDA